MTEDWREFEKLVARIEEAIGPIGAIIKSPDFLKDSVTGELREVDVSIRRHKDALPVRVIECRDRVKIEDVTWIEQLVAKSRDHGIPTIAVSSSGFSKAAVKKANHYQIETRRISELTQDEMISWVKVGAVIHTIFFPTLKTVRVELYPELGEKDGALHPDVVEQIQKGGGDAPVFMRHLDSQGFRATQILDMVIRTESNLFAGVPYDGTKVQKSITLNFEKSLFWIQTTAGPRDVSQLILEIEVHAQNTPSPLPEQGICYQGTERPTTYGIETKTELLGNSVLVSFYKQPESDSLAITIRKKKNS